MPNQITKAQKRAVKHHKGACLVLAGPGSGKTFVITNRLVHMVKELEIPGEHILVITFTKAAAMEMEQRFNQLLPEAHPWFGTFHSCFYYILRNSYTSIPTRFISTEEKHRVLREICDEVLDKELDIDLEEVERVLGLYMNNGLSMQNMTEYADLKPTHLKQLYRSYHTALAEYGYMDFDDLMLCCYQLLKDNPDVRKRWQEQFQYILVDECQDMNVLQYEILKLLTGPERNVFIVGDDDQSVYRFRGARVELMQRFIEEYKPVTQIQLDRNFRSTTGIVESSKKVIGQNKNRFAKEIQAHNSDRTGLQIHTFELKKEMYEFAFEAFQKAQIDELSNYAIIYRTNQELRSMAYKLRQKGIPYQSREDKKSIFDEDWYLDVEAYMRLGIGSKDRQYVLRVANKPNRFIKREQMVSFSYLPEPLGQQVKHIGTMRPYLAIKYIWSGIGYGRWLERQLGRDTDQWDIINEQLEEITQELKEYANLEDWIRHVEDDRELQKDIQNEKLQASGGHGRAGGRALQSGGSQSTVPQGVNLLTMHASKGLEFDTVYLLDVNKGKVPKGSKLSEEEIEEERRLFYVAMTRAKKHLHICYLKGEKDHTLQPSVFIEPLLKGEK